MTQNYLSLSHWSRWSPIRVLLHLTITFCLPWTNLAFKFPDTVRQSNFRTRQSSQPSVSREMNGLNSDSLFHKHSTSRNIIPNYITGLRSDGARNRFRTFENFGNSRKHHSRPLPANSLNELQSQRIVGVERNAPSYNHHDLRSEKEVSKSLKNKLLPLLAALYIKSSSEQPPERQQLEDGRLAKKPAVRRDYVGFSDAPFEMFPSDIPNLNTNENTFSDPFSLGSSEGEWGPLEQTKEFSSHGTSGFSSEGKFGPILTKGSFVAEPYDEPWLNLHQRGFASDKLGSPSIDSFQTESPILETHLFPRIADEEPDNSQSSFIEGAFEPEAKDCASIKNKICNTQSDCDCGGLYQCLNHSCHFVGGWSDPVHTEVIDPIGGKWHDATFYKKRGLRSTKSQSTKNKLGG